MQLKKRQLEPANLRPTVKPSKGQTTVFKYNPPLSLDIYTRNKSCVETSTSLKPTDNKPVNNTNYPLVSGLADNTDSKIMN